MIRTSPNHRRRIVTMNNFAAIASLLAASAFAGSAKKTTSN
jgi:hypothetical protein